MRIHMLLATFAALAALAIGPATALQASYIDNIFFIGGPGGTGEQELVFDGNPITLDYTVSDYIAYTGSIGGFFGPDFYTIEHTGSPPQINNGTPDHWSSYQVKLAFGTSGDAYLTSVTSDDTFASVLFSSDTIVLAGGPGLDPLGSFELNFTFYMSGSGFVTITETPFVPEPSSLVSSSLAVALTAVTLWRRRRA